MMIELRVLTEDHTKPIKGTNAFIMLSDKAIKCNDMDPDAFAITNFRAECG